MNNEEEKIDPPHYQQFGKQSYEMMIDIWGKEAFILHCQMTAFKYKIRAGSKPGEPAERDLAKAKWYLDKAAEIKECIRVEREAVEPLKVYPREN